VLGFDGGIGVRSEVRDGVYTGRPDGPFTYREGKPVAMREVAEREGIDLGESYAYSDSESDLPMLRCVGHPVAVNPDAELERVARAEGWRIIRFDKLGRRLKIAGGVVALAAGASTVGWASGQVQARRSRGAKVRRRLPR
jgi:phosphoserine phosphatase